VLCSFFGVYQVTIVALDKLGVVSEWSWQSAVLSAGVALLPFARSASLRGNLPVFALLVAMERWDKMKVMQRMTEEGVAMDAFAASGSVFSKPEQERA
jgi:hypothetical protein